ncbi:peptidoglycan recognition protein family protein [Amycolatopsis palatopharyngis]|uniref:peptidoglycan recognition protein family protein n=1 Tax=Amycolatopsis palatopharyngis TaxID=187982 RepID=UPI000E2233EC|nr:peptidoglycan recognition family protein [Amycolatopsis palatopharyngis]
MAWCPFAVHRPLSENHTQGGITPRAVILHTAWSGASSLYGFFQNNSNLESHFYVANDGTIEQYMDTGIRADANKNANGFAVSIETQDDRAIKSWNSAQLDALVRLVKWICDTHDIPKRRIESAYGSGIGWHVQFGAPGPWTPSAKTCPGGPRIEQVKNHIIPRVAGGGGGAAPGGDDMSAAAERDINAVHAGLFYGSSVGGKEWPSVLAILAETQRRVTVNTNLLARKNGIDAGDVAEALAPQLAAVLLPDLDAVMREALGADNAGQAEAIITALSQRLAEQTTEEGQEA